MRNARRRWRGLGAWVVLTLLVPLGCGGQHEPAPVAHQPYDAQGRLIDTQTTGTAPATPPNLIVIVLDALRADALPLEGQETPGAERMPFLSRLANEGVHFTQAVSSAPWTLPSMVSLFTGLRPSEHGLYSITGPWLLTSALTTFAEILQSGYGYETAAFVNGPWFDRGPTLLQGFTRQEFAFTLQDLDTTVARWNQTRYRSKPFFLLLHTYDPHDPYGEKNHPWPRPTYVAPRVDPRLLAEDADPAEIFRAAYLDAEALEGLKQSLGLNDLGDLLQRYKFRGYAADPRPELAAELRDAYWDGVAWTDGLLEQAYGKLENLGLLENTLLVVLSDHGETFGEHGHLSHGLALYDEVIRVPLVMSGPPPFERGNVVTQSVGLVDVLPTFLDWIGADPLPGIAGRSALPLLDGVDWCRPVVSEERLDLYNTGSDDDAIRVSVRTLRWKYIVTFDLQTGEAREEAYDLLFDPAELMDIAEGTGRLPDTREYDDCLCEAVEAVRRYIWNDEEGVGEQGRTPYGTTLLRVNTPRPRPCDAGQ